MITCVIIDDEENARIGFKKLLERYFSETVRVVGLSASVSEGVKDIIKFSPDIVFLDIEMPVNNGFKLFDYFKEYTFEVIFTTAFKEYAIDAIKHAALDYLLKPINQIDLREAFKKYNQHQNVLTRNKRIETLINNLNTPDSLQQKIALPTSNGYQMEPINKIMYCKADINYSDVFLNDGTIIKLSKTLKSVEESLPEKIFVRIHKTYLLNINYVKKFIRHPSPIVIIENNTELEVATRRIDNFVNRITQKD